MSQPRQRGFTLVSAIFIVVVLAALAGFIAVVSTSQQMGSALDVQGANAYQAARAGVEWGAYQVWNSNTGCRMGTEPYCTSATPAACPAAALRPATTNVAVAAGTLAGFTISVTCAPTADPGGVGGPTVFTITAVACNQPALQTDGRTRCPILSTSLGDATTDASNAGAAGYIERRVTVTI